MGAKHILNAYLSFVSFLYKVNERVLKKKQKQKFDLNFRIKRAQGRSTTALGL